MNGAGTPVTGVEAHRSRRRRADVHAPIATCSRRARSRTRACCSSRIRAAPASATRAGMVGRNLMFHSADDRARHLRRARCTATAAAPSTHGFADFRGVPERSRRARSAASSRSAAARSRSARRRSTRRSSTARSAFDGARFKTLMRQSPGRDRVVALVHAGRGRAAADEPRRSRSRRSSISTACRSRACTYQNHAFELGARDVLRAEAARHPRRVGRALRGDRARATTIPGVGAHHGHAALRHRSRRRACATPTAASTTSATCTRADGALFPTSSGFNPTLTIIALAMRVAAAMVNPGSPETALV